ncbi:unnamed protein product [Euphydryas editha]|uniref:Uncharacterized protein n=1 Tax=Euphydryas editha TaxID=104508 RepID=A0AAU9V677_EUPED|nr:unnamed protein product [Euphydryas editha]
MDNESVIISNNDNEFNESINEEGEISISSTQDKSLPGEDSLNKSSCEFEDADCGEPISVHRIVLNFKPIDELDNDDVQRKCCEFWDFVNSRPELNSLIVKPKPETVPNITKPEDMISVSKYSSSMSTIDNEKTAVSVLEFVEENGLISRAFTSRMATPFCDDELNNYSDEHILKRSKVRTSAKKQTGKKQKVQNDVSLQTSPSARNMCEMLHEWDLKHPKSFSPPGPVPDLEDSMMNCKIHQ